MIFLRAALALGLAIGVSTFAMGPTMAQEKAPFIVVVMDPLAAPLSCPCVKGYAQRDYDKLGKKLETALGRPVIVQYAESLAAAKKKADHGHIDLIIGKESVVRHDCKSMNIAYTQIAALSGKDGKTTMTGLFVVAATDPALAVGDLKGYQLIFGPADADEKHLAALGLLKEFKVSLPGQLETCNSCSDGALKVLALHKDGMKAATVISSYAQPLLEGCGTIKKGDLRVIGETDPVPFVVAVINNGVRSDVRALVEKTLFAVGEDARLREALETKSGFVAPAVKKN